MFPFCSILISLKPEPRKANENTVSVAKATIIKHTFFCAFPNHAFPPLAPSFMSNFKIVCPLQWPIWEKNLKKKRVYICIYITDSLCCIPETNTTFKSTVLQ